MILKSKLPSILTPNIDPKQFGVSGTKQAINLYTSAISQQVQQSVEAGIQTELVQLEAQITAEISAKLEAQIATKLKAEYEAKYEAKFKAACIEHIIELNNQLKLERARMFGKKSEVLPIQDRLFNEAELAGLKRPIAEEIISDKAVLPQPSQPAKPRNRGKRKPLSKELPRVEIIHELAEHERICSCCNQPMQEIGEDVSEQLDSVPAIIRVLCHKRKRYACPKKHSKPITAAPLLQVLPKTNASNNLLATLVTCKYVDGLPLERFAKVLARHGAIVSTSTLARWAIGCAQQLQPIYNSMQEQMRGSPVIHMDETTVQVIKEPDKPASSNSYMWVRKTTYPYNIILFTYDSSRSGDVPLSLLGDWDGGYLMVDAYSGYNAVGKIQGIELMACWAHARRKFIDAIKVQVKGKTGLANEAVQFIAELYHIESKHKTASVQQRMDARQKLSLPILQQFKQWLMLHLTQVPPKTTLGTALSYLHNHWSKLIRYCERSDLPIDNNPVENAIRPFVIGRKAWLFANTVNGAKASALLYSLVETAKANNHEPYLWLSYVLNKLPIINAIDDSEKLLNSYDALLPWNLTTEQLLANQ